MRLFGWIFTLFSVNTCKISTYGAKIDLFFLQGTVVSTEHLGMDGKESLNIRDLCESMEVPVIAGNCVTYDVAQLLMNAGVSG